MKEKLIVITAHLAFAIPVEESLDAVYDSANMALIPQQHVNGGSSGLIDYAFIGEPIEATSPVEPYDYENGFDLPRWEVQAYLGASWENIWRVDDKPHTFDSETEAKAAIYDFLTDVAESGMEHYSVTDYRVRKVGA